MKFDSPSGSNGRDDSTTLIRTDSGRAAPSGDDDTPSDRMAVHLVWEIGLLLLAGGVLFALTQTDAGPFADGSWTGLFAALAPVIMLTSAMAVSLRIGAVNLAVGPIALFAAWMFTDASSSGSVMALGVGLGVAAFVGIVLATLTAWLRAPGWAASGAVGGAIGLWAGGTGDPSQFMLSELPSTAVLAALGGAIGVSLFLGLVGAFSAVRARIAPIRRTPAGERHGRGGLVFFGVLLSSTLAGAAGVVAAWTAVPEGGAAALPDPILLTVLALGAALVGGTSLMGRRGGVFGTVLASTLLLGLMWLAEGRGWGFNPSWIALGAIVAGFLITRLVEVMNTADENETASTRRAGNLADLREDDPPAAERDRADAVSVNEFGEYDEDFAGLGTGDPWTNTGGIRTTGSIPKQGAAADPFGASGVFDDLRDTPRDGYGTPRHGR
jgi:ribose/xylose/arabinose/galactoside ABC-type transport system permease subunit